MNSQSSRGWGRGWRGMATAILLVVWPGLLLVATGAECELPRVAGAERNGAELCELHFVAEALAQGGRSSAEVLADNLTSEAQPSASRFSPARPAIDGPRRLLSFLKIDHHEIAATVDEPAYREVRAHIESIAAELLKPNAGPVLAPASSSVAALR